MVITEPNTFHRFCSGQLKICSENIEPTQKKRERKICRCPISAWNNALSYVLTWRNNDAKNRNMKLMRFSAHTVASLVQRKSSEKNSIWPKLARKNDPRILFNGKYDSITFLTPIQTYTEHWSKRNRNHNVSTAMRDVNNLHVQCIQRNQWRKYNASVHFIAFHHSYKWIMVRLSFDSCLFADYDVCVYILLIDLLIAIHGLVKKRNQIFDIQLFFPFASQRTSIFHHSMVETHEF